MKKKTGFSKPEIWNKNYRLPPMKINLRNENMSFSIGTGWLIFVASDNRHSKVKIEMLKSFISFNKFLPM